MDGWSLVIWTRLSRAATILCNSIPIIRAFVIQNIAAAAIRSRNLR
jgi:hypothetical protein